MVFALLLLIKYGTLKWTIFFIWPVMTLGFIYFKCVNIEQRKTIANGIFFVLNMSLYSPLIFIPVEYYYGGLPLIPLLHFYLSQWMALTQVKIFSLFFFFSLLIFELISCGLFVTQPRAYYNNQQIEEDYFFFFVVLLNLLEEVLYSLKMCTRYFLIRISTTKEFEKLLQ